MESEITSEISESGSKNSITSFEADVQHTFFYTDSKFFTSLDTNEIMSTIIQRYPLLSQQSTDSVIKKQIIVFLNDATFIEYLMEFYNLTVYDMFKILYMSYGSIFKGPFLNKVKNQLVGKKYATITRKKRNY